jgi:hypothetical protein
MAQQKSSLAALKEKAAEHAKKTKEIQNKIRELENARILQVGKLVADYHKKNWEAFEAGSFKKAVAEILES